MRTNGTHADSLELTRSLSAQTARVKSSGVSSTEHVGLMPYIGVGTFFVAALLNQPARARAYRLRSNRCSGFVGRIVTRMSQLV